jgi:hypothetical protein
LKNNLKQISIKEEKDEGKQDYGGTIAWKVEVCSDVMFYGNKLVNMNVEQSLVA